VKTIRVIPRPLHQLADDKEYASRFSRMLKSMPRQHGSQIMGGGLSGFTRTAIFGARLRCCSISNCRSLMEIRIRETSWAIRQMPKRRKRAKYGQSRNRVLLCV